MRRDKEEEASKMLHYNTSIPAALANAIILFSSPVILSQAALTGNAGSPPKKFAG